MIDNSGPGARHRDPEGRRHPTAGEVVRQFAAFLKDYDPELRTTLHAAPGQITQLQGLVADAQSVLPGFSRSPSVLADLFRPYTPAAWAGSWPPTDPGSGCSARPMRDGQLLIEGIPQRSTRCDYGTPAATPRTRPASDRDHRTVPDRRITSSVGARTRRVSTGYAAGPAPARSW